MRRFQPVTSAAMQAALRTIAERHGYTATRGPRVGQGNPSELIQALDAGELATVLLDSDERWHVIAWLDQQAQVLQASDVLLVDGIQAVANQLRFAAKREQEIEQKESDESHQGRPHADTMG